MAKAYRFYNVAALNVCGATVYLPAQDAAKLAKALKKVAQSILSGEAFGDSDCCGPDVADYPSAPDAQDIGTALANGLIRVRETSPGHWRASYRVASGGRFHHVQSAAGPIDYASPRAAYSGAVFTRGRRT